MHFLKGYDYRLNDGCALTIGAYESLHIGHQAVIAQTQELARKAGLAAAALIFEPPPGAFFAAAGDKRPNLYRLSQRLRIFDTLRIDKLICLHFCHQLAAMSAEGFTEKVLVGALNVKHIVVGKNFRFGKERSGDYDTLRQLGERFGFSVHSTEAVMIDGKRVSSTWVRQALGDSDFNCVERLLGRQFSVQGRVITGMGRGGKEIGFPTANISCEKHRHPLQGVYAGRIILPSGATHDTVINAGVRPTVCGKKHQLEAHILNFSDRLYGHKVELIPLMKIRDEQCFESIDALRRGIAQDISRARDFFASDKE